jgi:hypothetical protein
VPVVLVTVKKPPANEVRPQQRDGGCTHCPRPLLNFLRCRSRTGWKRDFALRVLSFKVAPRSFITQASKCLSRPSTLEPSNIFEQHLYRPETCAFHEPWWLVTCDYPTTSFALFAHACPQSSFRSNYANTRHIATPQCPLLHLLMPAHNLPSALIMQRHTTLSPHDILRFIY